MNEKLLARLVRKSMNRVGKSVTRRVCTLVAYDVAARVLFDQYDVAARAFIAHTSVRDGRGKEICLDSASASVHARFFLCQLQHLQAMLCLHIVVCMRTGRALQFQHLQVMLCLRIVVCITTERALHISCSTYNKKPRVHGRLVAAANAMLALFCICTCNTRRA